MASDWPPHFVAGMPAFFPSLRVPPALSYLRKRPTPLPFKELDSAWRNLALLYETDQMVRAVSLLNKLTRCSFLCVIVKSGKTPAAGKTLL